MSAINDGLSFDGLLMKPDDVDFVIYHGGCIDGFTSAYCVYEYLNNKYPDREVTYHYGIFERSPPFSDLIKKNVLICDFSYSYNDIMKIINVCNKFCILDHHKSALNNLKDVPDKYKIFRMDHCGSYLTWRFFNQEKTEIPLMITYVEDNDIWLKKQDKTCEFTAYMYTLPFSFEEYGKAMDDNFIKNEIFVQGTGMVKQNNTIIAQNLKHFTPKFIQIKDKYYFAAYLNSSVLKSELGHKAFEEYKNINFSIIYTLNGNNSCYFSFRSLETATDVSEIASHFGGGGHAAASGVTCYNSGYELPTKHIDNSSLYNVLNNIYLRSLRFDDQYIYIVCVNSSQYKNELGKYLLQQRYKTKSNNIVQECVSILRNQDYQTNKVNNNIENTPDFCHMSVVWHYDGPNDKTWHTLTFSDNFNNYTEFDRLKEFMHDVMSNPKRVVDYEYFDDKCVFTTSGCNPYF